ncbi:hypothetical protein niasHT_014887 [Heterodera trifolii]|uniref:Uncharacterized protein n=1 Tax=Heterodera trifolii TaxID=157864 RepID=A0ABD2LFM6_9BILA
MTLVVGTYFAICLIRLLLASGTDPIFILHITPSIGALLTITAASSNALILFAFRKLPLVGGIFLTQIGQQQQQLPNAVVSMVAPFNNNTIPQPSSVGHVQHITTIGGGGGTAVPKTMAPVV